MGLHDSIIIEPRRMNVNLRESKMGGEAVNLVTTAEVVHSAIGFTIISKF